MLDLDKVFRSVPANCALPSGSPSLPLAAVGAASSGSAVPAADLPKPMNQGGQKSPRSICDAQRTVAAGGAIQELLLHPSIRPFEHISRRNPVVGIYGANPSRVFTFEIGAFTVPNNMILAVAEWKFSVYRFSGAFAGEPILLDDGLCSLNIGCDFNIEQGRNGNVVFELNPINPQTAQAAFTPVSSGGIATSGQAINPVSVGAVGAGGVPNVYAVSNPIGSTQQQNAFIPGAGIGSALMPYSDRIVQGPSRMPFTYYARESQSIQLRISVYRTLNIPIAYFESRVSGYLLPIESLTNLLNAMAPCDKGEL